MKLFILKFFNRENEYSRLLSKSKNYQKLCLLKKCSIKIIFNILAFVFLIIARNLYIKSLLGCDGEEFKCVLSL